MSDPPDKSLSRALLRRLYHSAPLRPLRERLAAADSRSAALAEEVAGLRRQQDWLAARIDEIVSFTVAGARGHRGYVAVDGHDPERYGRQLELNYRDLVNPFAYYRDLVDGLVAIDRLRIRPLYEFPTADRSGPLVGLRHDIDGDPVAAVRAARHLARLGICGSFYPLHTARYYGLFHGGTFVRNPQVRQWIEALIVAGCEIGMHNDALGAHMLTGIDGAAALATEIEWLRSQGALVRGTVGHNSAPSYGAENSEVFKGRRLWDRPPRAADGTDMPLEALDEKTLGLEYEGTFARPHPAPGPDPRRLAEFIAGREQASVRSEPWMRTYLLDNPCCIWDLDCQFWLIGRNEWVIGGRLDGRDRFEWKVGLDRVLEVAAALPDGSRSVFVVHPVFVRA